MEYLSGGEMSEDENWKLIKRFSIFGEIWAQLLCLALRAMGQNAVVQQTATTMTFDVYVIERKKK